MFLAECDAKQSRGREKYGPDYVGRNPMVEFVDEIVDAFNYLDWAEVINGDDVGALRDEVRDLGARAMGLVRSI